MDRGRLRLNALLAAVAASLGLLVGLVSTAERRPTTTPQATSSAYAEPPSTRSARQLLPAVEPRAPSATSTPNATPAPEEELRIEGVVLHADGTPAEGARVRLGTHETLSDGRGHFVLTARASDAEAELVAVRRGYLPAVQAWNSAATSEVRLVLGATTQTISGHVHDPAGGALAGWNVALDGFDVLDQLGLREPLQTDASGAFTIPEVPPGVHVVCAWKERRELAFYSEPIEAGSTGAQVVASAP